MYRQQALSTVVDWTSRTRSFARTAWRIMTRDFGSNRRRISKDQRQEILRLYTRGEARKAQLYATSLGLREECA